MAKNVKFPYEIYKNINLSLITKKKKKKKRDREPANVQFFKKKNLKSRENCNYLTSFVMI
jgi:hypothetical protein